MDRVLQDKIEQKIRETLSKKGEATRLLGSMQEIDSPRSFLLGVVVGRMYNAFYYQTRRIMGRDPTGAEFEEFLGLVRDKDLEGLW